MKKIFLNVSKFKEMSFGPGKKINLSLQHEGKLIEFFKRVKSSFATHLYKDQYI